jgi:hypothetical protein
MGTLPRFPSVWSRIFGNPRGALSDQRPGRTGGGAARLATPANRPARRPMIVAGRREVARMAGGGQGRDGVQGAESDEHVRRVGTLRSACKASELNRAEDPHSICDFDERWPLHFRWGLPMSNELPNGGVNGNLLKAFQISRGICAA